MSATEIRHYVPAGDRSKAARALLDAAEHPDQVRTSAYGFYVPVDVWEASGLSETAPAVDVEPEGTDELTGQVTNLDGTTSDTLTLYDPTEHTVPDVLAHFEKLREVAGDDVEAKATAEAEIERIVSVERARTDVTPRKGIVGD